MEQQNNQRRPFRGNTLAGLLFLLVGGLLLMRQVGYPFPPWLFSWKMILIVIGVFIGIRNNFRDFSWLAMVLIGFLFLSDDLFPGLNIRSYIIPIIVIILGLVFIFVPKAMCRNKSGRFRKIHERRMARWKEWKEMQMQQHGEQFHPENPGDTGSQYTEDTFGTGQTITDTTVSRRKKNGAEENNIIDIVSIFSGIKRKVLSKEFKGGEIICVFGGAEVNMANTDFNHSIELEMVQIFGGAKLIVPANWEVRSEVAAIFGGVDDKRPPVLNTLPEKTIILKGTVIFGGIEINSF